MKVDHRGTNGAVRRGWTVSVVRWVGNTPELVDGRFVGQDNGYWQLEVKGELLAFPADEWELCLA